MNVSSSRFAALGARSHTAAFGFFCVLILYWFRSLLLPDALIFAPGDSGEIALPNYYSARHLWTYSLFGGYPVAAEPQTWTFYLPAILAHSVGISWNSFLILSVFIMGGLTYGFAYSLTRSSSAALIAALIFSCNRFTNAHFIHANIFHVLVWWPGVFWAIRVCMRPERRALGIVLGGLAASFVLTAGHPQIAAYCYLAAGCYAVVNFINLPSKAERKHFASSIALMGLLALLFSSLQWLFTFEILPLTQRAEASFHYFVSRPFPWQKLVTLFYPNAFLDSKNGIEIGNWSESEANVFFGAGGVFLLIYSFGARKKNPELAFFFCLLIGGLILSTGTWLGESVPLALSKIPVYGKFRVISRHLAWTVWAASLLAAFGFARLLCLEKKPGNLISALAVTAVALLTSLVFFQFKGNLNQLAGYPLDFPLLYRTGFVPYLILIAIYPVAIAFILMKKTRPLGVFLFLGLLSSEFIQGARYAPGWIPLQSLDPSTLELPIEAKPYVEDARKHRMRIATLEGNRGQLFYPQMDKLWGIESIGGSTPLALRTHSSVLGLGSGGDIPIEFLNPVNQLARLWSIRYVIVDETSYATDAARKFLSQSRWRLVGRLPPSRNRAHWQKVQKNTSYGVYQRIDALPRIRLVPRVTRISKAQINEAITQGFLPDRAKFDPSLVSLTELGPEISSTNLNPEFDQVEATEFTESKIAITVKTSEKRLLVLSDTFYPGWKATVDKNETPIYPVDANSRGIVVPRGEHSVELAYRPWPWWLGCTLTGLGILLAILILLRNRLKK